MVNHTFVVAIEDISAGVTLINKQVMFRSLIMINFIYLNL